MSTHYTSDRISLARIIRWKPAIFGFLIPLLLVISTISAYIDNIPHALYVMGATWLYILAVVGALWGAPRMLQVHAAFACLFFLGSSILAAFWGFPNDVLSTTQIAGILFGIIAVIVEFHFRIFRLESRGKSTRSADFPGIYRITCLSNGKQYIGQTSQAINARWGEHRAHLASRRHHNRWLQADWDIYRPEQFKWEVLEVVTDPVWLLDRERAWQDMGYDAAKRYNPPNLAPRIVKASRRPPMKRKR
jgi:hypothetical protein